MNPLVSIICPCYNQAQYLEETIESALKSTYRPIEIMIINDGSTDNSMEVAKKLSEKYQEITVIDQSNRGVCSARNNGIRNSNGSYILCLDSDDLISDNYIAEAIMVLENQPEVKVVYCEAVKFNEQGQKAWRLKPFSRNLLARDNMIYVSAIFRRSDWERTGGFSEDMLLGRADWDFWIKMLKDGGEVIRLPFIGFYYRLTGKNSMRKRTNSSETKRKRIAYLNEKYPDFFERELNGPLRFQRTWSKPYNTLLKLLGKL
ncbi:glycosyltransferase family 2 protein [Algoriphagus namhaensis]|uniref:Glycosyltransferase family 2 protein n=1 Tax=Algoriphagus namhaensis TaxID=915353 RepID=A0ABV8AYF1_9BACT